MVEQALEELRMRLLDLTARNRLINFRHTKLRSLHIIDELPDELVKTLLDDREMRFLSVPEPSRDELIEEGYIEIDEENGQEIRLRKDPTAKEWAEHKGLSTAYEVPKPATDGCADRHADTAIQTLFYPCELETRLKGLLQNAESAIQEMGTNILYLGFGFLEWYDNNNSSARLAPLFLVPVRLHKGRLNQQTKIYEYRISYSDEDIITNLSLREKLHKDFGMALPKLDENTAPEAYFAEVREMIQDNQPRWCVHRYITLALLDFSKLLMYLDLDRTRWSEDSNLIAHPVVKRFLVGQDGEEGENGDLGFGEEYPIDEKNDHIDYPLIEDADSSQHSALIDAVDGKNLVIEGPPGTGKSQTITNLIAAAMAQGKHVLFVAEKLAALEVVRRRLDAAGLGEFCLELHSHKSQRKKVLGEVKERLDSRGKYRQPEDIQVDIDRYEEQKTALKEHVERVNRKWKNTGRTLHQIFMAATRYRKAIGISPDLLCPEGFDGNNFDKAAQQRINDQVTAFRLVYEAVIAQLDDHSELQEHPWHGVRNTNLQMFDIDRVKAALEAWQNALHRLIGEREKLAEGLDCERDGITDSLHEISALLAELEGLPALNGDELLNRLPMLQGKSLEQAQRYLEQFEDIQSRYVTLSKNISPEVLQDLSVVDSLLAGSEQLCHLVEQKTKLGELAEARKRLETIQSQLDQLVQPLQKIQAAVGAEATQHLLPTKAGFSEFIIFVNLVAGLRPSYWELRDELFDNDVLDDLLPKLRDDLERLRNLRAELRDTFNLNRLPSQNELQQLKETLEFGGVFRWFKRGWRIARKQTLGHAAGNRVKFPALRLLLDKAAEFAGRLDSFDRNARYQESFGEYLKGMDTDLDALEALRDWYKKVRQQYGLGFGPQVTLGNAILELPAGLARSVRSLFKQGVQQQLKVSLNDLSDLNRIFAPVLELQNDTTPLAGKDGAISRLLESLEEALRACAPMTTDNAISIGELAGRINALDELKKTVSDWESADVDNRLFQGRLNLQTGVNAKNTSSLSMLRNTLAIAVYVDQRFTNENIRKHIYKSPSISTFHALAELAGRLRTAVDAHTTAHEDFAQLVELEVDDWRRTSGDKLDNLIIRNNRALDNGRSLQNWLSYVRERTQVSAMGFSKLVEQVEKGGIDIQQVEDAYQAGIFDVLAREILREQPELGRFSGSSQEARQKRFRECDTKLKELHRQEFAWKIDHQNHVPPGNSHGPVRSFSELGLLNHVCNQQRPRIPIRGLVQRAGNALVALKPCFMMGPLSVAQYLKPGQINFDLVIMDEASQIKPEDALGAIARGSQVVIVGDPKQLPPTNFFDNLWDDGNDDGDGMTIQESESILDAATSDMFSARQLRWHYRSQHESLIAFSNHSFYGGDLVLFPSPHKETDRYGIKYSRVQRGCFIDRRNKEEAGRISKAVQEHFKHCPEESLGVVAMNLNQQRHIEDAIEKIAKDDPVFHQQWEENLCKEEPFFVKNLENVQGDERDVIFISMTYGPREPGGRVFQRFGPINSDVGWRRLNVLFTRSKKRMHIFSSMGSQDVLTGGAASRGVHALHDFLSFCETDTIPEKTRLTGRPPDSDFEIAVIKALGDEGFDCAPQVGVAGYFIDIAVADPDNPGRYLMGIECDGATYHSAKSTRDRDRLRQAILEHRGWKIRRIWSTDWFQNPDAVLNPLIRELNALRASP